MRKCREHGVPRKLKLATLQEVDSLPRPWHFEFWVTVPDDLPFSLSHVDDDVSKLNNNNNNNSSNIEIVINDRQNLAVAKSEPIAIESTKPRQLFMTDYFQTTEEAQEVVLPSPAKSRLREKPLSLHKIAFDL